MAPSLIERAERSDWVAAEDGLLEQLPRWESGASRHEAAMSRLPWPGLVAGGDVLVGASRLPGIQARWIARQLLTSPNQLTNPAEWRRLAPKALIEVGGEGLARSGTTGRELIRVLRMVAPTVLADFDDPDPTEPSGLDPVVVRGLVTAELGSRLADLDDDALAVGAYSQRHRGTLDDGREVTIVVRRPGISRELVDDARVVTPLLWGLDRTLDTLTRVQLYDLVRAALRTQLDACDQRRAAIDAVTLAVALERAGTDDLRVARPVADLVTKRVAVYSTDGATAQLGPTAPEHLKTGALIGGLVAATLETGLADGIFLAGLDPSSLDVDADGHLVAPGGVMLGRLDLATRRGIADLLVAAVGANAVGQAEAMVGAGILPAQVDVDVAAAVLAERPLVDPMAMLSGAGPDLAGARTTLTTLALRHGARVPPSLALFGVGLVRMGAVLRRAKPDVTLMELGMNTLPRLAGITARMED